MATLALRPRLQSILQRESMEPVISWGLRMAVVSIAPILWGYYSGHAEAAEWITLAAECICWVELKGTFSIRLRLLFMGTLIALCSGLLGSVAGAYLWAGVAGMVVVGFTAALFRNLGDRGSGLAICVFLLFIFGSAHPVENSEELGDRVLYILAGAGWNAFAALLLAIFMPVQQPYRRSIAHILQAVTNLSGVIGKGYNGESARSNIREVYLKEKEVRLAIDQSLTFHEQMAHQVRKTDAEEFALAQVRKATSLTATHLMALHDELEGIAVKSIPESLRVRFSELYRGFQTTTERLGTFVLSLKSEDGLLVKNRLDRLKNVIALLKEYRDPLPIDMARILRRIVQLSDRIVRLTERSLEHLHELDDAPVFRSYSLIKTLLILHPKYWWKNIQLLFNLSSHTLRYALRTAIAAGLAYFIYKFFHIQRGYWLPLTVLIVLQPYFGATYQKAIDRIAGTIMGGLAGGLLLQFTTGLYLKEVMLFVSATMMVYYLRKKYVLSAFFITINLVCLFSVSEELNMSILWLRLFSTLGGAALAVIAGFALLPNWDRRYLPMHLANALALNYYYLTATFFTGTNGDEWLRKKRSAETENSNAFDSFNRYMQEPGSAKEYALYYQLITHNVRLTRELNNIHLEQEAKSEEEKALPSNPDDKKLMEESLNLFNTCMERVREIDPAHHSNDKLVSLSDTAIVPFQLSLYQKLYLEKLVVELRGLNHNLMQLTHRLHPENHLHKEASLN